MGLGTDAATLEEVIAVLLEHISIEMEGDFQPQTLFEILVHAASNAQSIEQTSKTLDAAPTGNDVRRTWKRWRSNSTRRCAPECQDVSTTVTRSWP